MPLPPLGTLRVSALVVPAFISMRRLPVTAATRTIHTSALWRRIPTTDDEVEDISGMDLRKRETSPPATLTELEKTVPPSGEFVGKVN